MDRGVPVLVWGEGLWCFPEPLPRILTHTVELGACHGVINQANSGAALTPNFQDELSR
jgi:hypothetical protein